MQSKLDIYQPVLMAGFLIWLLAYRVLCRRNGAVTSAPSAAAGCRCGARDRGRRGRLLYMVTSGVNGWRVLLAHFDIDMEVRPAWWVLVAGLMAARIGFWRCKPARQRAERPQDLRRRRCRARPRSSPAS